MYVGSTVNASANSKNLVQQLLIDVHRRASWLMHSQTHAPTPAVNANLFFQNIDCCFFYLIINKCFNNYNVLLSDLANTLELVSTVSRATGALSPSSIIYDKLTRSLGRGRRDGAKTTSHHLIGAIMKINDKTLPPERHKAPFSSFTF